MVRFAYHSFSDSSAFLKLVKLVVGRKTRQSSYRLSATPTPLQVKRTFALSYSHAC
jgi:hypothetical protein